MLGDCAGCSQEVPRSVAPHHKAYTHFTKVLRLYAKCHSVFNGELPVSRPLTSLASDTLVVSVLFFHLHCFSYTEDISAFMAFYRESFPNATILPKMHILEDHVVPWMRRWRLGARLMGEQGAESIHTHLHKLESQYCGLSTLSIGSNML